jgi:DNA-binding GntR family transcriptional regulator
MPDAQNGLGTEAVYQRVREAILNGEIAAGATMSQVALADELGISRTPLREALRMLQSEGLVDAERNRRVRVALEGYNAEMAHYAEAKDYRRWVVPHQAFHRALTSPAGDRFTALLTQLFDHAERYRRMHIGHGPSAWATKDHRDILDACKARDREQAGCLLAHHFARTAFELIEILEPGREPALLRDTMADVAGG